MTTILITGGAGFIGSRLAANLAEDHTVVVFDNLHPQVHDGNPENRNRLDRHGIKLIEGDIRDAAAVAKALADTAPDYVYHLAAETGTGQSFDLVYQYCDVNVMGTVHLIDAIRKTPSVRRVMVAGSRSVYGEGACVDENGVPTPAVERFNGDLAKGDWEPKDRHGRALSPVPTNDSCPTAPASIYASTKLAQEHLLGQSLWGTDIAFGVLRLQNVYGAGQSLNNPYTGVLSIFCRQIQEGKTLNIYEDGKITRDFVHVDDVVTAFAALARSEEMPQDIFDIGSGEQATILDVAQDLLELLGQGRDNYEVTGAFRPGDIRFALADTTAAREKLGWEPRIPLKQGLRELVDWSRTSS